MTSTAHWFTIGRWLMPAVAFLALTVTAAGDSEGWDDSELAAFAADVLKSINDLRKSLNTKPLKLDPDKSDKGLNGLARMYAKIWSTTAIDPLPLEQELSWVQVFKEESGKKFEELDKVYRGALLYFDLNKAHITGSTLVKLAARALPLSKPEEADFVNHGDSRKPETYTCNTVRKLLWSPAETIGVSVAWNKKQTRQSYVILFDEPLAKKKSIGKLSNEAIAYLGKLKCIHLAVDDQFPNPVHDEMVKEAFEDEVKGAWTEPQAATFRKGVAAGISALREDLGGKGLTLDDDLTKAATIMATFWGPTGSTAFGADQPWVLGTIKETKIKDLKVLEAMRYSAIMFQHTGGTHLKPDYFLRLLKDVDPDSRLLGLVPHRFCNDRRDTIDRDGGLQVYCYRLKQLLWVPAKKFGLGMAFHPNSNTMFYVMLFDSSRKKFEKERGKFTPSASLFLQARGNECRMDFVGDHGERFRQDVFKEIQDLRTAFGRAFGGGVMKPLAEKPELMKQAAEVAKAWAHNEGPADTSALPKGFILYAKQRTGIVEREDAKPTWNEAGIIQGEKMEIKPKMFVKHLLDADRFGVPLPVTKQSPTPVSLTASAPTAIRLSQILCPEATEFGFAVATYVYNADPVAPDLTQHFVLLFNAQCDSLPKITDENTIKELVANGWVKGKDTMWWFTGDINKLRLLEG